MSGDSTPYNSAPGSPTPLLMSVTTDNDAERPRDEREVSQNLILGVSDDIRYHETGINYVLHSPKKSENWTSEAYIPTSADRCLVCPDCKKSSNCAAINDGFTCVCCGEKKACLRRSSCERWLPHMKSNWRKSLTALNQQMKQRYDESHLEYLPKWKAHFIKRDFQPTTKELSPPSYEQLGAPHLFNEQIQSAQNEDFLDCPKSLQTEPPETPLGSAQLNKDNNEGLRPQDLLKLLANMEATNTARLKEIQDNLAIQQKQFCDAMQQQQLANKSIHEQLRKVQEEGRLSIKSASSSGVLGGSKEEEVGACGGGAATDLGGKFHFGPSVTGAPHIEIESRMGCAPPIPPPTKLASTSESSTVTAVDRLAAVLEKQLTTPKHSTRLPSLTLPKLIKSNNNQIVGTNFFSFKKRCLQLFAEHNVGDSIAVHLLQTEESLPKRFRQSLNNCSTVAGCFQTMESMTEPLNAVYPQLIKELCSVDTAFDNAAQIKLCDNVCRILLQMFEHYPDEDIQIAHVTAVLSAFSSPHEINTLPSVVASFQHKHDTTHKKFSTLLYDHCIQRRADLYSIIAALQLWRRDDPIHHNLIQTPFNASGRGGGRGGGGSRGGYRGRGASNANGYRGGGAASTGNGNDDVNDNGTGDGATAKIHYRGGTKQRPGICGICNNKTARHKYYNCNKLAECRQKKTKVDAGICTLCIRPLAVCSKTIGKCYMIKSKDGTEISLLCKKHTSPPRYFGLCSNCEPNIESPFPTPVPHLHIQTLSDDDEALEDDDGKNDDEELESGRLQVVSASNGDDSPYSTESETPTQAQEIRHFTST